MQHAAWAKWERPVSGSVSSFLIHHAHRCLMAAANSRPYFMPFSQSLSPYLTDPAAITWAISSRASPGIRSHRVFSLSSLVAGVGCDRISEVEIKVSFNVGGHPGFIQADLSVT